MTATYTYPFTLSEPCPGSGKCLPPGHATDLTHARCSYCGRSTFVHAKGALAKHSKPRPTDA